MWSYFVELLAFIQWFIILFTGQRNQGLWDLQYAWLGYYGRVTATWTRCTTRTRSSAPRAATPRCRHLDYEEPANRLTNGLRFIWAIPALDRRSWSSPSPWSSVVLISWFAILFTGKHPRGMFDFSSGSCAT